MENCLLAVMAYDHYVASCHPLSYSTVMNSSWCVLLALFSLLLIIVFGLLHMLMALNLSFCTNVKMPHFLCELAQLIKLACSDTLINNILVHVASFVFGGIPISGIIFSYTHIVSAVLKLSSPRGRYKTFSTCGFHLSASLFYWTILGVYISSTVIDSPEKSVVASVMYSVIPQMLNPFIYCLKSKDMKEALKKFILSAETVS